MSTASTTTANKNSSQAWIIITLAALFYCYEFFLRVIPSTMTDDFMRFHNIHAAQIGVIASYYYYAYSPMQLLVGPLLDRFGSRNLLTIACLVCAGGIFIFSKIPKI